MNLEAPGSLVRVGKAPWKRSGLGRHRPQRRVGRGQAALIAERVANAGYFGYGPFAASSNDVLVFSQSAASTQQLTWYDREGKALGTVGEPADYAGLALSADGTRLALGKNNGLTFSSNIWLLGTSPSIPAPPRLDHAKGAARCALQNPTWLGLSSKTLQELNMN